MWLRDKTKDCSNCMSVVLTASWRLPRGQHGTSQAGSQPLRLCSGLADADPARHHAWGACCLAELVDKLICVLCHEWCGAQVFHVKVTNLADKAYYMDSRRGDWALKHEKDAVIYEGDVGIVSVGGLSEHTRRDGQV